MSLFTEGQTQLAEPIFPESFHGYLKIKKIQYLTTIFDNTDFIKWHIIAPVVLIQNILPLWMVKILMKPSTCTLRAMWWAYGYEIDLNEFGL